MSGIMLAQQASYGRDLTPGPINWTNIGPVSASGFASAQTNSQTISGIDEDIVLTLTFARIANTGFPTYSYSLNGGSSFDYSLFVISDVANITVGDGDQVAFKFDNTYGGAPAVQSGTVTVTNASTGGTLIDTFTYSVTATP